MERKIYDTKLLGCINFYDYWNLREHPLYIKFNKKEKPYYKFNEVPEEGYKKVDSLSAIAFQLRNNDWTFQTKYWESISNSIQASINLPYTEL